MTRKLEALIAQARGIRMDEGQARAQRLSFVYGNTYIENDLITRDIVAKADRNVRRHGIVGVLPGP